MRQLLLALLVCTPLCAQGPAFFITDPTGSTIEGPLGATYQFADTPQSSSATVVMRAANLSSSTIEVITIFVGDAPGSNSQSSNFTVSGVFLDKVLSPGSTSF